MQFDSIDGDLRTSLWNVLRRYIWNHVQYSSAYAGSYLSAPSNEEIQSFCTDLWCDYFKKPLDDLDDDWEVTVAEIKEHFFSCKWYKVYDFVEFAIENFPYSTREGFVEAVNGILQREVSAYRVVAGKIVRITDEVELDEIDTALIPRNGL